MKVSKLIVAIAVLNIIVMIASASVVASIALSTSHRNTLNQEAGPTRITNAEAIALVAAAIGLFGSTIAAGIALKGVATAGLAAMIESPEAKTWMLIMGGLAEGIAVYGLLLAILIYSKIP